MIIAITTNNIDLSKTRPVTAQKHQLQTKQYPTK